MTLLAGLDPIVAMQRELSPAAFSPQTFTRFASGIQPATATRAFGRLGGLLQNPLFGLGVGLLSAGEQGQGIGQGLLMGSQFIGAQQALQSRNQDRELKRRQIEMQMQRQKAADEAQRLQQQALQRFIQDNPQFADLATVGGPEAVTKAMLAQMQGQDPTSLMQNLAAAGLQPGTPEYQEAVQRYLFKPVGTTVNVGTGPQTSTRLLLENSRQPRTL